MKKTISLIILTLMTACALAQDLYIGSYYVTSTDEEKLYGDGKDKWTTRMPVIVDMFKYEQPDILGLQSLTTNQLVALAARLTNFQRAGDILYNNTCELDTCGTVEGFPTDCTCSWAKLRKEEKDFLVFNIFFTPDSAQAAVNHLRTSISAMNQDNLPVFVVGNLGVNETKQPYSRLIARYNDCYTKATVKSAEYGTVNNFDLENNHDSNRYDFVFASKNVTVKAYGQLQYAYFTSESGSYKRRLPSTHFPVMAKVKM
jgi:endonuclease/exonuclease/phosphatase family metal-dependent hydrolase